MRLEDKVRYGAMAMAGAAAIAAGLGVHVLPLDIAGGVGTS